MDNYAEYVNKNPTRCNSIQIFIYCKVTTCYRARSGHVGGKYLYQYYDLYRRLQLQVLVPLMMGAVTPETCRVTLQ